MMVESLSQHIEVGTGVVIEDVALPSIALKFLAGRMGNLKTFSPKRCLNFVR